MIENTMLHSQGETFVILRTGEAHATVEGWHYITCLKNIICDLLAKNYMFIQDVELVKIVHFSMTLLASKQTSGQLERRSMWSQDLPRSLGRGNVARR
jgi:hypothetical protein